MQFTITASEQIVRFDLSGDIDEQGAADLKTSFEGLNLSGLKCVTFDFAKVIHIGSAGLGKLLLFYKKLATVGAEMRVENAPDYIRELLNELNLNTLFAVT